MSWDVLDVLDDLIADMGMAPGTTGDLVAKARDDLHELILDLRQARAALDYPSDITMARAAIDNALARVGGAA